MARELIWSDALQEHVWAEKAASDTLPVTEAQGERIIQLLEQLASLSQGSLDKEIAEDIKRHSISYPSGC